MRLTLCVTYVPVLDLKVLNRSSVYLHSFNILHIHILYSICPLALCITVFFKAQGI
jgi:hypothetical protein